LLENTLVDAAVTPAVRVRKMRFITAEQLDGRTRSTRRMRELQRALQRELGHKPNELERTAIERVCVLAAIAEDARTRLLSGKPDAPSLDAVTRADNCARRALRDLRAMKRTGKPAPTLREYLERVNRAKERQHDQTEAG
jgi:hypothetical protein